MQHLYMFIEKTREEITRNVAKSAAISGAGDGIVAAAQGEGLKKIAKEATFGVITGAAGAGATEAYRHFTKNTGITGLLVGAGTSIVTRHVLRGTFPDKEEEHEV